MKIYNIRKKPVKVQAVLWDGDNIDDVCFFTGLSETALTDYAEDGELLIETKEGTMRVSKGDYIIRGVKGELYPCKPDILKETYEFIDGEPQ